MATIEELNFKLIVDDAEFNAKVKDVLKTAQDLNANLSQILDIKQKISSVSSADVANQRNANKILADNAKTQEKIATDAERAAQARRKAVETTTSQITRENAVNREKEAQAAIKTQIAQEKLNQLQERGRRTLMSTSRLWQQMASMAATYFSVVGATRLVKTLAQVSAEFEMQRVTLGAILQDTSRAGELFGQIKELAVKSPFQFKDLMSYVKQLSAFSVPVGELYDTTKMLADVSAGLGVGMDRLVLAYGQIRSASFLRGQEVRQLTEAGIPILEELRKQFVALGEEGITVGEVFDKISKRLVPFSMVEKVFKDMTSEGGKFYKMQEVQAETLKGKISNLTDAYQIMFSEIGENNEGLLKGAVDILRGIAENYQKIGAVLMSLVTAYGAYRAALVVINALEIARRANMMAGIKTMRAFSAEMIRLTGITKAFNTVQKALGKLSWPAVVAGAITAVATAIIVATNHARKFRTELEKIGRTHVEEGEKMVDDYNRLVASLDGVTKGSQRYRDVIGEINRKYGEYLPKLLTEQTSLAELTRLERELTSAIYARMRAYAQEEGSRKIQDEYGEKVQDTLSVFLERMADAGIAEKTAESFAQSFRDRLAANPDRDVFLAFEDAFQSFFDSDKLDVSAYKWNKLEEAAGNYGVALRKVTVETNKFSKVLDTQYGSSNFGSMAEDRLQSYTEKWYKDEQQKIRDLNMATEDTEKALEDLYVKYVRIKKSNFEKDEKAKNQPGIWQQQIQELDKILTSLDGGELSTLQARVSGFLTGEGVKDLLPEASESQTGYFDKLRKDYEKTKSELADVDAVYQKFLKQKQKGQDIDEKAFAAQEADVKRLQNRQQVIEKIADDFGIQLEKARAGASSAAGRIPEDIQDEVDSLKELYTWIERFKELGLSEESAKDFLEDFYPGREELLQGDNLKRKLYEIADALTAYGDAGENAAKSIRELLAPSPVKGRFDSIKDQFAAFEKYRQKIQDWMDRDYNLAGTGLSAKISGILSNLATKNAQAATDANDLRELFAEATKDEATAALIREKYGQEAWDKYLAKGESVIDELLKAETRANKEAAQERINSLADEYVRRELFERNLNLSDWADKSLSQVLALRDGLREMYEGTIDFWPKLQEQAKKEQITLEELAKIIQQIIEGKLDESTIEAFKKLQSVASTTIGSISSLGDIMSGLGDGIDDRDLRRFGKILSTTGEILETIVECDSAMEAISGVNKGIVNDADKIANSTDLWTMAIKVGLIALRSIADSFVENYQLQLAINEAADEYRKTIHAIALEDANTIFGTDNVRKAAEGIRYLKERLADLQRSQDRFSGMYDGMVQRQALWFTELAKLRGYSSGEWQRMRDEWEKAMNGSYEDNQDFFEWLVANQEVISERLYQGQRSDFDKLMKNLDAYKEAWGEYQDMMGEMFGTVASDIADSLINAFIETGDAATGLADNMRDTFSELGLDIANSLISSFVISNILDKYKDTVESLFGYMSDASANPEVIAQKFGELATNISKDADAAAQFTNNLLTAMQNNGIDLSGESGTKAMGNGIKSITEDTANLLASYINAIRADVSVTRTMVATILGLLPSAPTLSEYLAQIQANTYNNAVATQAILERLDSSMAAFPAGGRAFNVNIS